jgi:hypothetical protein
MVVSKLAPLGVRKGAGDCKEGVIYSDPCGTSLIVEVHDY